MRWIVIALVFLASSVHAQSTGIQILDEDYSLTLSTSFAAPECLGCPPIGTATIQRTISSTPLENELQTASLLWATGAADMFSVSAAASAGYFDPNCHYVCGASAHATAETWLSFRALQDTTALLTFSGALQSYTWGFFSLFDQTTGANLFSQTFGRPSYSGDPSSVLDPTSVSFSASLDATHIYKLTLRGDSGANWDNWGMSLGVSGFYPIAAPVPEPETYAMLLAGLVYVGFMVRRRDAVGR